MTLYVDDNRDRFPSPILAETNKPLFWTGPFIGGQDPNFNGKADPSTWLRAAGAMCRRPNCNRTINDSYRPSSSPMVIALPTTSRRRSKPIRSIRMNPRRAGCGTNRKTDIEAREGHSMAAKDRIDRKERQEGKTIGSPKVACVKAFKIFSSSPLPHLLALATVTKGRFVGQKVRHISC